ncbi:MAG: NusG domain II-containing protein [Ruminococcus sp.]|nr:NusG domain II-containing protein [Ruminococcus sp.]
MTRAVGNFKRKYFALGDLPVVLLVLSAFVLGLIMLFSGRGDDNLVAVVSVRGEVYSEISLAQVAEPYDLTVEGDESVVLHISSDGVEFVSSDCPDKLCVNTGLLTRSGQSAVCLPARVSVKLVSETGAPSDAPDAVAG